MAGDAARHGRRLVVRIGDERHRGWSALNVDRQAVKSTPVLPYWFDSQTYGVRPAKKPIAAAQLRPLRAAAAQVPVEADARRPHRSAPARRRCDSRSWRPPIGLAIGHVREVRHVDADAVGQREVRLRAPLVAGVDAELPHRELGRLERIGGVREVVVVEPAAIPAAKLSMLENR